MIAISGDVGSLSSPILVHAVQEISAGACSTCLADFNGSSVDDTVHAYTIKDCEIPPPPPPPHSFNSSLIDSRFFAVEGMYDSEFNLPSDYYFFTYVLDEKCWKKAIPLSERNLSNK